MVEIELDGQKIEASSGQMLIQAVQAAGHYIPHFCYHKKLSVAANCRMCLVDIEKIPKPMPACATPVTAGMVVSTRSEKIVRAQRSVMEFLLINHPLDCPICDQGGECQLQDLAVGYGEGASRYGEKKRVVSPKDVGPLISMEEMSRCIHCTRCVRFGQEVAGVMELGMVNRGGHSEITTVEGGSVDSELSGNMIDLCPVGALTSKPFRYSARTWELSRRKSIAPHDSTGANLIVQVRNDRVMRVLPLENEAVNECWIADRDRFSYEALNSDQRLTKPMLKQGGQWFEVQWQAALEYVVRGLGDIRANHGAASVGALVSPHCTLEEMHLTQKLIRGLGSDNIDYRLRNAEFERTDKVRWLGRTIESLSTLQRVLVVGSNLRKDHPLFAQRIRQAVRRGGCVVSQLNETRRDWALPVTHDLIVAPREWTQALQDRRLEEWLGGAAEGKSAILLGNAAAHHPHASELLELCNALASATGATVGYLTEAANTVGAQLCDLRPKEGGMNAAQMLADNGRALRAAFLVGCEPMFDSAAGEEGAAALARADMVVSLNAFKANMDCADVLLPIAPFTETSGTFVNAEARVQSFHAVVKPLGETRPAWKVLRVLGNLLDLPGFEQESSSAVAQEITKAPTVHGAFVSPEWLDNAAVRDVTRSAVGAPSVASIYALDGLVRRAASLQRTRDARVGGALS